MMCFSQSRRNSASVSPADEDYPRYKRSNLPNAMTSRSSMISRMSGTSIDEVYHGANVQADQDRIFLRRQEGTNIFHDRYGNEVPQVSWKVPVAMLDPTLNYHTSIGRVSRMSPANHAITRSRLNSSRNFQQQSTSRQKSRSNWQEEEDEKINELDDTFSIESMTSLERYVEDIGLSDSEDDDKPAKATHGRKHSRH